MIIIGYFLLWLTAILLIIAEITMRRRGITNAHFYAFLAATITCACALLIHLQVKAGACP